MKRIVILGAGESGIGAAILAQQQGFDVFVSDGAAIKSEYKNELIQYNILFEECTHTEDKILNADIIIKSPGIPEKNELLKKIRSKNIEVISEIEWAYRFKGDSKIIAITGSNGKTTTTSITYHLFKLSEFDCAMVGNIGYSFARQVALQPKALYIVEVSSFQLDDINSFRADVAIITNITEDHLDRYEYNVKNYIKSKFNIIKYQTATDIFIYNLDDPTTIENINNYNIRAIKAPITMSKELPEGAYLTNAELHIKWKGEDMQMNVSDFALKGTHNRSNSMAASLTGYAFGIRKEKIREAMQTVETLAHRMEPVVTIKGVEYINDSKATNVNSTWYALESMEKPTILILGGVDKGNNYDALQNLVKDKVKAIICLGADTEKLHEAFKNIMPTIINTLNMIDAVQIAYKYAAKGDIVLLSPACASFDLFKNYEDRGDQFKRAVKDL